MINKATFHRNPHSFRLLLDFRETGSTAILTANSWTPDLMLAQGFVLMEDPDDGDEYEVPVNPWNQDGETMTTTGILHFPQVAAMFIAVANDQHAPEKPEIPSMESAESIILAFRAMHFSR